MSALSIQVPFPVFQDRDGQPLENGYIWIGEANLNPQTNPVVAYYDAALTIVAPQPLRTLNGYVSRAGTPAQIYVDGVNFSILVQDSKGLMVYNFPDGTGISPDACGVTYNPPFTGAVPVPVCEKLAETVSVKDFGAVGDGVTDDTAAIQAAINAAGSQFALLFPSGTYIVSSTLNVNVAGMTLIGERNNYTYGIGVQSVNLKWTAGTVGINTYVPPESSTSGDNSPYITFENLTINGNSVLEVGVDGGFFLTMRDCSVLGCTVAGLRLGVGSQTSKYYNCGFNGNQDGVLGLGGGTHFFYDCVFRQNTRYGLNADISVSSFYNCIFESNAGHGVYLTDNCHLMLFHHCYMEQNDVAQVPSAYHAYINQTNTTSRTQQIKFDTCFFGSISTVKVANVVSGGVIFENCFNVGDANSNLITVTDDAFVRARDSFMSNSALLPAGMGEAGGVFFDPSKALICEGVAGRVVLASPGITLGSSDFSVSLVCSFNNVNSNTRTLITGAAGAFTMIMTGSVDGVSNLNFGAIGSALQSSFVKTPMTPDIPIHIAYVRESGAFKLFINGQKVASGTDANNYSGANTALGGNGVSARMDGRFYAAKIYSGALTFDEVWSICKNGGNFVTTSTATETWSLEFENRIPSVVYESIGQRYLQNFGAWAVPTSESADFTPVVFGTSSAGVGTYDYQRGSYRLFDGYCYFQLAVKWTAHTGTGNLRISGLPFTSRNLVGMAAALSIYSADLTFPAGATQVAAFVGSNTNVIELRGAGTGLAATAVAMDASGTLMIAGHYEVALS